MNFARVICDADQKKLHRSGISKCLFHVVAAAPLLFFGMLLLQIDMPHKAEAIKIGQGRSACLSESHGFEEKTSTPHCE